MKLVKTIILYAMISAVETFGQSVQITATDLNAVFSPGTSTSVISLSIDAVMLNPMIMNVQVDRIGTATDSDVPTVWLALDKNKNNVYDTGDLQLGTTQSFSSGTVTFSNLNYAASMLENILVIYDVATNANVSKTAGSYMGTNYIQGMAGTTVAFSGITTGNNPLPVELVSFSSELLKDNSVLLKWSTATEVSNYGFEVERSVIGSQQLADSRMLNADSWVKIGFIQGYGNSNSPRYYKFVDGNINSDGKYLYRLKQIDTKGTFEYSNVIEINTSIAASFELMQNYPNPFNPTTQISWQMQKAGHVSLTLYDVTGKQIAVLVNENRPKGMHTISFNASSVKGSALPSGVYFYKISTNEMSQVRKMVLAK